MKSLDDVIENEIRGILLKESSQEENKSTPLEKLDAALKNMQHGEEALEALFAPYLIMRDLFKLATTGLKLILNDVVFVVKSSLAIRPSSWKLAREAHDKRMAKLNKDWEASLEATGANSNAASLISFLALPAPMISAAVIDQGFKTVAHINHALVDSGIRLPLVGLLPGATPPEEIDMDEEELKKKKRGELSTKDAVKVALMKLFFAHHAPPGNIISEEKDKEPSSDVEVTPNSIMKALKDMGVYDKMQSDLAELLAAKKESVEIFMEKEEPVQKIQQASMLLKAKTPEEFVKAAKSTKDPELSKAANDYVKKFQDTASKIGSDKEFQKTYIENKDKPQDSEDITSQDSPDIDKEEIKQEAIKQVFAKSHPEFTKAMTESLASYARWVVESIESIYKIPKVAMKNPAIKKAIKEKDEVLAKIISNISL